ncbi:MAG: hypothetical protein ACK4IT_02390 [Thioalkalivibrionaceae bacterium]
MSRWWSGAMGTGRAVPTRIGTGMAMPFARFPFHGGSALVGVLAVD